MHHPRFASDKVTLGLRVSIIAADIVAFAFLLSGLYLHQNYFYVDGIGTFIDGLPLAAVLVSLIWTGISLFLKFYKGAYHPGVDVGMELCAWGVIAGTVWYLILWLGIAGLYHSVSCSARYAKDCTFVDAHLLFASEIIAAVALVVCGVLHFTLFVRACREAHLTRRLKREATLGVNEPQEIVEHVVVVKHSKHDVAQTCAHKVFQGVV